MASSAMFLTVLLSVVIASTNGFKIETTQPVNNNKYAISSGYFNPISPSNSKTAESGFSLLNQPIAGYPKVPPPNAHESGGLEDDLLPPFEDKSLGFLSLKSQTFRRSIEDVKVDPKTGYPLVAQPSWKDAGGNEESLDLPLEDEIKNTKPEEAVDPKTGYPLVAQPSWKFAGGNEESLELPLEDEIVKPEEAVDPKTGYPLVAQPSWQFAGGDGDIIQLPFQDSENPNDEEEAVDPKTGYPLVAKPSWKDAGGNEEILELPLEDLENRKNQEKVDDVKVDPKTGYPLEAQPSWQDAGGNGDILELPLEDVKPEEAVDPKTGYPLVAQPSWQDAGGNGEILELPHEDPVDQNQVAVDPKTGYPLVAEPFWKDAGGNGEILDLPLEDEKSTQEKVDPKTGYPLVAQPSWQYAGGDESILDLPVEEAVGNFVSQIQGRSVEVFDEAQLTELRPPPVQSSYATNFGVSDVPANTFASRSFQQPLVSNVFQRRDTSTSQGNSGFNKQQNKPIESTYTYTGPENVVVSVTRFLSTDNQERRNFPTITPTFQNNFAVFDQQPHSQSSFSRRQAPAPISYQRRYY